ncbi:MAG: substrate-binding domain-containing protein [Phycisphaerae bacterium]|nr:substrate-binding domain-containing protein [Phycisphaerae bacterium]
MTPTRRANAATFVLLVVILVVLAGFAVSAYALLRATRERASAEAARAAAQQAQVQARVAESMAALEAERLREGATANTPAASTAEASAIRIGYSQCNRGEPWREQMDKDIKAHAAKHPEIQLIAKDAQNEALRQIAQVKEFVSGKVDTLIISPKDTSLTAAVAEAFESGIPVIVLDRAVEGEKYTCFIGADNRLIGAEVGKWVVKTLNGTGNVVELKGLASTIPSRDRSEPFHDALKSTGIKVLYEADMEWLSDRAREKMQAALSRNPQKGSIQLVYGANDPAAIAAYNAAKDAGRENEIIFVGVDALPHEGVEMVRRGVLAATFEYPNGADLAIETALRLKKGEAVPKKITLGTRLFTRENVDQGGTPIPAKP